MSSPTLLKIDVSSTLISGIESGTYHPALSAAEDGGIRPEKLREAATNIQDRAMGPQPMLIIENGSLRDGIFEASINVK